MIRFQTICNDNLIKLLSLFNSVAKDGRLEISADGLRIRTVTSEFAAVDFWYPKHSSLIVVPESMKTVSIGVDFKQLSEVMDTIKRGELVTLETNLVSLEGSNPTLKIRTVDATSSSESTIKILQIPETEVPDANPQGFATVNVDRKRVDQLFKNDSKRNNTTITFAIKNRRLSMNSQPSAPTKTVLDALPISGLTPEDRFTQPFPIKSLILATKCGTLAEGLELGIGSPASPLKLLFNFPHGGYINFLVRPAPEETDDTETDEPELPEETKPLKRSKSKKITRKKRKDKSASPEPKTKRQKREVSEEDAALLTQFKKDAVPPEPSNPSQKCAHCGQYIYSGSASWSDSDGGLKLLCDFCAYLEQHRTR